MLSDDDLRHLRRCVELATEALADGDEPFFFLAAATSEVTPHASIVDESATKKLMTVDSPCARKTGNFISLPNVKDEPRRRLARLVRQHEA